MNLKIIHLSCFGRAIGIGISDILGVIDGVELRIGPIHFKNRILVLHDCNVDFLIGLDILRRFNFEISFGANSVKLRARRKIIRIPLLPGNGFSLNNGEFSIQSKRSDRICTGVLRNISRVCTRTSLFNEKENNSTSEDTTFDNISMEGI